ncbi:MAG: DNA helicase PriA [Flavobacteriales bacterium]|nr:DNA helicase PriA [Flavobacteriales bacterium]
MPEAEIEKAAEGAHKIHCSKCGAELRYQPGTTELVCDYCGTRNHIEESSVEIEEQDLHEFLRKESERVVTETVETVECNSCGAINPFDETNVAKACIFCGGHLIVKDAAKIEQIKPQALVPFQVEHRRAIKLYKDWLHSRWFAPNDLKRMQNLPDKLKGIYMPFWTYDAMTVSEYTGQRGITRTETETYTVSGEDGPETRTRTKTRTDWYPASGVVEHFFDDELILANPAVPSEITMKLRPWDLSMLVPFEHDYLRGFLVESYSVGLEEGYGIARQRIDSQIRTLVRRDIGGDQQRITTLHTDWSDQTFKHILLPIYVSAYKYKGKTYRFLINGQTGEVQGKRPYSAWKITFLVLAILLVIAIIVMFAQG